MVGISSFCCFTLSVSFGITTVLNKPHRPTVKHSRGGSDAPSAPAGKGSAMVTEKQTPKKMNRSAWGALEVLQQVGLLYMFRTFVQSWLIVVVTLSSC